MDGKRVRLLLEKYYNGETSAGEEDELRRIAESGDVPDDMRSDAALLAAMRGGVCPPAPEGLAERVSRDIDDSAARRRRMPGSRLWLSAGMAASVALLLAVGVRMHNRSEAEAGKYAECRQAYAETEKALTIFSERLNEGLDKFNRLQPQDGSGK